MSHINKKATQLPVSEPVLSPRLQAVAELVDVSTACMADIGTDHAYLPIWLILHNRCRFAIASDLREGPAKRARQNIRRFDLSKQIEVRIGDGLTVLADDPVDLVVIAGMGGLEMIRILRMGLPDGLELLLQPQKSQPELRKWLVQNGFGILDERIACDRQHYYTVLRVIYRAINPEQAEQLDDVQAWIGPRLMEQYSGCNGGTVDQTIWYGYLTGIRNRLKKTIIGRPDLKTVICWVDEQLEEAGLSETENE